LLLLRAIALIAICGIVSCAQVQTSNPSKEPTPPATAAAPPPTIPEPSAVEMAIESTVEPAPAPSAPVALPLAAAAALGIAPTADESITSLEPPPLADEYAAAGLLSPPAYANVWERIRAGFKLPEIDDPLVRKWENFYAVRPEYWQRINERGKRYLYFITAEIERRGMPLEIALLPIIESAYNPTALSRARASGIWQFVPATGKIYGLQQNWWLDNRRDVTVATGSALDYLQRLHQMFGDWQLALASYNWGEGAVQRAINRNRALNKPTDYASLKIPTETRNYLPKLQAVKNLVMAPE
jgi:membrane-bound lytic murein transglycosylase D